MDLLCWVPSEKGTILYVCLQERPTRPFEKQHLTSVLLEGETGVSEVDCERESDPSQVPAGGMVGGRGL